MGGYFVIGRGDVVDKTSQCGLSPRGVLASEGNRQQPSKAVRYLHSTSVMEKTKMVMPCWVVGKGKSYFKWDSREDLKGNNI